MMAHNVMGNFVHQLGTRSCVSGEPSLQVMLFLSHSLLEERFQPVPARNCCLVAFSRDNSDWAPAITRAPTTNSIVI
jgi:hypothetical protein